MNRLCYLLAILVSFLCLGLLGPGCDGDGLLGQDEEEPEPIVEEPVCSDMALFFDFEGSALGFTHSATDEGFEDPWELGQPEDQACYSGESCWGTRLDGEYDNCEAGQVASPEFDFSACAGSDATVELRFWQTYRFENPSGDTWWDGGFVQLSGDGGATWENVSPSPGYEGVIGGNYSECEGVPEIDGHEAWSGVIPGEEWSQVVVPIDEVFRTDSFRLRLVFGSDRGVTREGWLVDALEFAVE